MDEKFKEIFSLCLKIKSETTHIVTFSFWNARYTEITVLTHDADLLYSKVLYAAIVKDMEKELDNVIEVLQNILQEFFRIKYATL